MTPTPAPVLRQDPCRAARCQPHPASTPRPGRQHKAHGPSSNAPKRRQTSEQIRRASPPGRGAGGEGAAMIRSPHPNPSPGGEGLLSGPGASRLCEPCARCPCPQGLPEPETRALANRTYTLLDDGRRLGSTVFLNSTERSRSQIETLPSRQQFPPGGNRPLKSPRFDAPKVEIAPQSHHGTASPAAGGNCCRAVLPVDAAHKSPIHSASTSLRCLSSSILLW